MHQHTVKILQKEYHISCSKDEVAHLQQCADYVNHAIEQTIKTLKPSSEMAVLSMTLLTMADQLMDLHKTLQEQNQQLHQESQNSFPDILIKRLELLSKKISEEI